MQPTPTVALLELGFKSRRDNLAKHIGKLPQELRRFLTWDRGKKVASHKTFTIAIKVKDYFCDSRSPWQRGTNENTSGLLRQ